MKTVILGIGNTLMGDEGVGVTVARYIEDNHSLPDTVVVDGGTGGFHLLEYFEHYPRVILIDATIDGQPPGTIAMLRPKFSSDYPPTLTAHDIGLKDMLDALYLMEKQPEIILFTVSIGNFSKLEMQLSPDVQRVVSNVARKIVDFLSHSGS